MGGSLKISFSNGCCCIRYHLLIRISFRFGTAGWYCATKVVVVLGTTCSLGFLSGLELLGGIVLRRTRFVSLYCSVGGEPVFFLQISLLPSVL